MSPAIQEENVKSGHFESTYQILDGKTQGIYIKAQGHLPLLIINYR
jgi:hypothetical protein